MHYAFTVSVGGLPEDGSRGLMGGNGILEPPHVPQRQADDGQIICLVHPVTEAARCFQSAGGGG